MPRSCAGHIFLLQTRAKCGKIPISVEEWADAGGCAKKVQENRESDAQTSEWR